MATILGEDRQASLARELTKTHEEFLRGTLQELANVPPETLIGEMVIVVEGAKEIAKEINDEDIISSLNESLKTLKSKDAIKEVANKLNVPKNRVYDLYLKNWKN